VEPIFTAVASTAASEALMASASDVSVLDSGAIEYSAPFTVRVNVELELTLVFPGAATRASPSLLMDVP
jgi:hypothetical protein